MRIADVNGFYAQGGGGVRRYVDAKFLAAEARGHWLSVIAPGERDGRQARPGGEVRWIASPPMPLDPRYRRFADRRAVLVALAEARPDIVEASSPWTSAAITARWPGAKALVFHQDVVAAYGHTALDRLLPRPMIDALALPWWARLRRLARRFDVTIAGGDWLADRLLAHGIVNARAVPFGLEAGGFDPERRDAAVRAGLLARCGVAPDGALLLAVSRFHPEKRLPTIIHAFARARRIRGDLGLVIVGDGLARASIERAVRRTRGVALLGRIDDRPTLARILASADLFVHGSAAETYGLAVAEALASGLTVVCPDHGGAADLAKAGRSRLYRVGHVPSCAQAIIDALAARALPAASAPRSLDDHFADLFAHYEALITPAR